MYVIPVALYKYLQEKKKHKYSRGLKYFCMEVETFSSFN